MDNNQDPYEDKWSGVSVEDLVNARPLGVSILAFLQIIGAILSLFLVFSIQMFLSQYPVNETFGIPLMEILIIFAILTIPVSLILGLGLLNGEIWARKMTILLQITNVITSLINFNIIGILFAVIIIHYLKKPDVSSFFTKEPRFGITVKNITLGLVILLIVFNISSNIFVLKFKTDLIYGNDFDLDDIGFSFDPDSSYSNSGNTMMGTWKGESMFIEGELTIILYADETCKAYYEDEIYNGKWSDERYDGSNDDIIFDWNKDIKLPDPINEGNYYSVSSAEYFVEYLSTNSGFRLFKI